MQDFVGACAKWPRQGHPPPLSHPESGWMDAFLSSSFLPSCAAWGGNRCIATHDHADANAKPQLPASSLHDTVTARCLSFCADSSNSFQEYKPPQMLLLWFFALFFLIKDRRPKSERRESCSKGRGRGCGGWEMCVRGAGRQQNTQIGPPAPVQYAHPPQGGIHPERNT